MIKNNRGFKVFLAVALCMMILFSAISCVSSGSNDKVSIGTEDDAELNEAGDKYLNADGSLYVKEEDKAENVEKMEENKSSLWFIYMPVGKFLALINKLVPSYIFSLLVFAILVKLLLFPFSWKQQKSMVKQAQFRPKERAIRNKYKGRTDQATMQKMNQEILDAQQKEGVNVFGGCLPMLIQLPIVILLYEVIRNPLSYVAGYSQNTINAIRNVLCYNDISAWNVTDTVKSAAASGIPSRLTELDLVGVLRDNWDKFEPVFGDIKQSTLPNFFAFGNKIDLSFTPTFNAEGWEYLYLLIPLITFVVLFFSMKLNRKMTAGATEQADPNAPNMGMANTIMDLAMPAMSTYLTFVFPAVLGIYWIFNNMLGTLQQFILKKLLPFPVFTEEDYKKAEKEYNKGKTIEKKVEKDPNRPKPKSLYHMDDEDYVDPVPVSTKEEKSKSAVDRAKLKDDRNNKQDK